MINVQIRIYTDSDGDEDYRLSLVRKSGDKVFIDRSSNRDAIDTLAEEIADFLDLSIRVRP